MFAKAGVTDDKAVMIIPSIYNFIINYYFLRHYGQDFFHFTLM